MSQFSRSEKLKSALTQRVLVLDGPMGTAIQDSGLSASDFGGARYEGCNEHLVLTRPELIVDLHGAYFEAGCDIVETNTFGATPLVLAEYDLAEKAEEINREAARLAREAADRFSTDERLRFVAGSMGPTTKALSVTGGITFDELSADFYVQAKGLVDGGADYLLLETCQDTLNIKAGLLAIERLERELGHKVPVAVSVTIESSGTMLAGQTIDALCVSLAHRDLLYLGLNCATGPGLMADHIRTLTEISPFPISCVPNAGLPDEDGVYHETPEMMGKELKRFAANGWLNVIGGCCGTTAEHIAHFAEIAVDMPVHEVTSVSGAFLSGTELLEVTAEKRPVLVGERTNVTGSRNFKRLICSESFEEAAEVARNQVDGGASIVDVCVATPDRDETADMDRFLPIVTRKVRAPIMIDSTDPAVIETALKHCQGKAIINSVNLDDGGENLANVAALAKSYGAALVFGTIDEDPDEGMAVTRERKLAIAERGVHMLTSEFNLPPQNIYLDPLTFPCATGDSQYRGSATETIEGIRLIKEKFPDSRTVLGVSNISFGLPAAGREVLNAVFLYHCVQAGLDLAIVNPAAMQRYAAIPEAERTIAEDLLFDNGTDPVAAFAEHFRGRSAAAEGSEEDSNLTPDQRVQRCIVTGSKQGLTEALDELVDTMRPVDIVNGPLMEGMDEVGRLFDKSELIVAEVLESAEAMKTAVAHLERHLAGDERSSRGKMLLATVKGDVHDIGKNLVDIIFSNNGFDVVNLGIKISPQELITAVAEHQPDLVGLSGLLVKSVQMMGTTCEDLSNEGIEVPVLLGGAALNEKVVLTRIDPIYNGTAIYAKDAMHGLEMAKRAVDPEQLAVLRAQMAERRQELYSAQTEVASGAAENEPTTRSSAIPVVDAPPPPPDYDRHVLRDTACDTIWGWLNPRMLFGRHLGVKGRGLKLIEQAEDDPSVLDELKAADHAAFRVWHAVAEVKDAYRDTDCMAPAAVYQFYRCASRGNTLHLLHPDGTALAEVPFPRQHKGDQLCVADFANPVDAPPDNCCLFVTSVGRGTRERAAELAENGEYLKSHILLALAIESAEGYAEYLHREIRRMWGIGDDPELTRKEVFQARYQGRRYSFGYPACPSLQGQRTLWQLLHPEEIGCNLTDELMMEPESSVSALVFHHPAATYFSVRSDG